MLCIRHGISDPYLNHAVEEVVAERYGDCFMLWENTPAILLGKHQNARREINFSYIEKNNIVVVRRITGGGAVYNDSGNLNFTFITSAYGGYAGLGDFARFAAPVLDALNRAGVPAVMSGRNDLTVDGKKISGNAECKLGNKIIHHGTLLFNSDLSALSKALTPDIVKFEGKGIKSVSSRVANILPYINDIKDIGEFKEYLFLNIMASLNGREIALTADDYNIAEELANKKYRTHSWNFGGERPFNIRREKRFATGTVAAEIYVDGGKIKDIAFSGDYFAEAEQDEIAALLRGVPYERGTVSDVLSKVDTNKYFFGVSQDEIVSLII
ncbi:MAG: lipoate--protein ligase [Clostridia bacterium]